MRIRDWDFNLKVRLFGESLMNITFWMFFPFLTIYFAEAFGKDKAGLLLILSQVFSVLANLLGGYCADRFGRKTMMVLSAFGQGICFILFAIASSPAIESYWLGFICFTFVGVFGAFYWPASQAMVADVVEEKHRSDVFAIFYTSINIAVVVGPILGALFYVQYRSQLLLIAGIVCILLALVLAKWTRETVPENTAVAGENDKWYSFLGAQVKDYGIHFQGQDLPAFYHRRRPGRPDIHAAGPADPCLYERGRRQPVPLQHWKLVVHCPRRAGFWRPALGKWIPGGIVHSRCH